MKYQKKLQDYGIEYHNKESFLIGYLLRFVRAFLFTIDQIKRIIIAGSYFINKISAATAIFKTTNNSHKRMGPVRPSPCLIATEIHPRNFHGMKNTIIKHYARSGHLKTRTRNPGQFRKPVVSLLLAMGFWLFTTTSFAAQICNSTVVAIPDFAGGVSGNASTSLTYSVGDVSSVIYDVDVDVGITHTYVGDLIADVVSPAASSVELFNRPGYTGTGFGCSQDNLSVLFTDGSGNGTVENVCNPSPNAINGIYDPSSVLSFLNGQQPTGIWNLNVSDNAGQDTGTIDNFCVTVTHAAVVFDKWVSNNATCSDQIDVLNAAVGSNVYYCYTVDNVGTEAFVINAGAATDDQLGVLTGLEGSYAPGATVTSVMGPYVAGGPQVPGGTTVNIANITVRGVAGNFNNTQTLATSETATVNVLSNLATSTKTVVDQNGVDPARGDVLRYTITLNETSGLTATGVSVTDDIPANVNSFTIISTPGGSTDSSTGTGTGANGNGFLNITNITVPASSSVTIVFDVTIDATAANGALIDNTATVTNPSGTGATPSAPTITVVVPGPATGNKQLYLYNNLNLSRTPPAAPQALVDINEVTSTSWTQTPLTQGDIVITRGAGTIPVSLWLQATGNFFFIARNITVTLSVVGATTISPIGSVNRVISLGGTPQEELFSVPITTPAAGDITILSGSQIIVTVTNNSTGFGQRRIGVNPIGATSNSRVDFNTSTVINVDSILFYDAAYPGGTSITQVNGGSTVYVRAVVSDPFGSFDITSADIDLIDSATTTVVSGAAMTQVADSGTLTKTYEYIYAVPGTGPVGIWTARVTANEGTEGTVTHTLTNTFTVFLPPDIIIAKTVITESDPVNNTTNPKAIPGAWKLYSITTTNQGFGTVDTNSIRITDPTPTNTEMFVGDLSGGGSPIVFVDGATSSALSFTFGGLGNGADDVAFSNDGGATWNYTPVPDANGYDANVTNIRINPKGTFAASNGISNPSFELRFRVRVQ